MLLNFSEQPKHNTIKLFYKKYISTLSLKKLTARQSFISKVKGSGIRIFVLKKNFFSGKNNR